MEKGVYVRKLWLGTGEEIIVSFGNSARGPGEYYRKGRKARLSSLLRLERIVREYLRQGRGEFRPSVDPIGWVFYWQPEEKEPKEKPAPAIILAGIMSDLDHLAIILRNSPDPQQDDLGKSLQAAYTLLAGILKTACNLP